MEVRAILPAFLDKRDWKIEFLNPGGATFPLHTGESRHIIMKLIPGSDFTPEDVSSSPEKHIHLYGYAGGILVGGMSYELDPNLKEPKPDSDEHGTECNKIAEVLLKCVEVPHEKVRRVRIRKVNVDIEFESECLD